MKTLSHIFDHTVKPVLLYGSEIWGASMLNKLNHNEKFLFNLSKNMKQESTHTKFCKFSLGLGKRATNIAALGEMGRYPLILEVLLSILRYYKYLLKSEDILLAEALTVSKSLYISNKNSWYCCIENLMKYLEIDIRTIKNSKIDLKSPMYRKLKLKYSSLWKSELYNDRDNKTSGNKLRTYRLFKNNISLEKYLLILNEDDRRLFTKFRVSYHKLEIEKGRYTGHRVEERICKLCNTEVEDETHFLLRCPALENKRSEFINDFEIKYKNFKNLPNESKLVWLMSAEDKFIIKKTSMLLSTLYKERNLIICRENESSVVCPTD